MTLPVDPSKFSAFLVAMFVMAIAPGPANLFAIATGRSGKPAHVFSAVAGLNVATLIWFIAAAFGLHLLILAVPLAFHLIAVLGALYLGWIGFNTFKGGLNLAGEAVALPAAVASDSLWATFKRGFGVQILNPKVTLFFSAVLPPFVDINRPMPAQMSVFAATTIGMDMISMTAYGLGAVGLSKVLNDPHNKQKFDLLVGLLLMGIAALICYHAVHELLMMRAL